MDNRCGSFWICGVLLTSMNIEIKKNSNLTSKHSTFGRAGEPSWNCYRHCQVCANPQAKANARRYRSQSDFTRLFKCAKQKQRVKEVRQNRPHLYNELLLIQAQTQLVFIMRKNMSATLEKQCRSG